MKKETKVELAQSLRKPKRFTPEYTNWFVWLFLFVGLAFIFRIHLSLLEAVASDRTGLSRIILLLIVFVLISEFIAARKINRVRVQTLFGTLFLKENQDLPESLNGSELDLHLTALDDKYERLPSGKVEQDMLIATLQSRWIGRISFITVGAGIAVALGLIGTLAGLVISFGGLSTSLGANGAVNDVAFFSGIREAMSGLAVAFYTTLVGTVGGSVLIIALHHTTKVACQALVSEIAEAVDRYYLPKLEKSPYRDIADLNKSLQSVHSLVPQLSLLIEEQASATKEVAKTTIESIRSASDSKDAELVRKFDELREQLEQFAKADADIGKMIQQLAEVISNIDSAASVKLLQAVEASLHQIAENTSSIPSIRSGVENAGGLATSLGALLVGKKADDLLSATSAEGG